MTSVGYAFAEALTTVRRSGRSAAMSIGTIAIAFLTLGGFLLISVNLQALVERWAAAAEMSVYVRDDIDEETRQALLAELSADPAVAAVEFVTKEQALERFARDFPELADVATAGDNPFPPAFEVRLRADRAPAGAAEAVAARLAERDAVADIQYDRQWLTRLRAVVTSIEIGGLTIAAVLVLGAAFTVAAVVRLSLQSRHEELEIMQLVGAPYTFIRGPSIAEGMLLGGIGALIALLVLWVVFALGGAPVVAAIGEWGSVEPPRFLRMRESAGLVLAGLLVGGVAGLVASRGAD